MVFTAYGLCAAAAMLALLIVAGIACRRRVGYTAFAVFGVLAVPLAFVCSRIAFCLAEMPYFLETLERPELMLEVLDGGASMTGAMVGVIAAAALAALLCRVKAADMLDAAALGMPVALMIERLAEPLCEIGWGKYFQSYAFDFMYDLTGGMHPVFVYEAVAAAAILAVLLLKRADLRRRAGDTMLTFLALYGATQTLLESLRNDGHMKVIHFVRVNQVAAIVMLVIALAVFSTRCARAGFGRHTGVSWLAAVVCIGFGVVQEFAADGDENPYFSYTLVSAILAALLLIAAAAWCIVWRREGRGRVVPMAVASVLCAVLLAVERTCNTGNERLFFVYGVMAANLFIIAHVAFSMRRKALTEV